MASSIFPETVSVPVLGAARRGMTKFCVLYLVGGIECRSPWFLSRARADRALQTIRAKHGSRAVLLQD